MERHNCSNNSETLRKVCNYLILVNVNFHITKTLLLTGVQRVYTKFWKRWSNGVYSGVNGQKPLRRKV